MATHTNIGLRSQVIYQVFIRQHSSTSDIKGLILDLDRIQSLGVDILYLLPIHPIGLLSRKGSLGSPYSIVDYYHIHPSLGTMADFDLLVEETKKRGMKVMIDIVFNHTSRDSVLVETHPNWFYRNKNGELANRVGDWSDITDLDFRQEEVWDYMIDVLAFWAQKVDGFRCDVAPLLPIEFWIKARNHIDRIHPGMIWLSESVHPGFIRYLRKEGHGCMSDGEMYQAFDICYDYDIYDMMDQYLEDSTMLEAWLDAIERQESIYPGNYIKLRSFENHDQKRLRSKVRNDVHFIQMVALSFFLKGTMFIYAGMEHQVAYTPSLFEFEPIVWNQEQSIEPIIKKLSALKHRLIFTEGHFEIHHKKEIAVLSYTHHHQFLLGIFNLENRNKVKVPLRDGIYLDIYSQKEVSVEYGQITLGKLPIIIETTKDHRL